MAQNNAGAPSLPGGEGRITLPVRSQEGATSAHIDHQGRPVGSENITSGDETTISSTISSTIADRNRNNTTNNAVAGEQSAIHLFTASRPSLATITPLTNNNRRHLELREWVRRNPRPFDPRRPYRNTSLEEVRVSRTRFGRWRGMENSFDDGDEEDEDDQIYYDRLNEMTVEGEIALYEAGLIFLGATRAFFTDGSEDDITLLAFNLPPPEALVPHPLLPDRVRRLRSLSPSFRNDVDLGEIALPRGPLLPGGDNSGSSAPNVGPQPQGNADATTPRRENEH